MDSNNPPVLGDPPASPPAPPAQTPPPLIMPPPSPSPRRSSRGWMIVALILTGLLMVSVIGNFRSFLGGLGSAVGSSRHDGHGYQEHVTDNKGSDHKIAIIEVQGIITAYSFDGSGLNMVANIKRQLELADEDKAVKAVVLKVDSPGGEVMASDDIYRLIRGFQKHTGKPVVAAMGGLAASGGYYVSAPCQWIVANELTLTGSIGVIMSSYNYRGLLNKVGVQPMVFKSGKFKDMLSGDRPPEDIQPEEREMVQKLIDETFVRFKEVVTEGREFAKGKNRGDGKALGSNWESFADGRILSGRQAFDLGFVDELGNLETAVIRAKKIAGIPDANLIRYEPVFDLANIFRLFGKSDAHSLKVDLGLDLPKLQVGRPYFLSPTFLH